MKKRIPITLTIWILQTLLATAVHCQSLQFVETDHQHYTFGEMITDLDSIAKRYPDFVSYELDSATTLLGHRLPVVTLGNRSARHHIMVQATMHAREYMATQLTMALLEHYAQMCYQDICKYKG